jgi:hypothetical protein
LRAARSRSRCLRSSSSCRMVMLAMLLADCASLRF